MIEEQRLERQLNLLLEYFIIIQRILEDIQSNEIDVNSLRDTKDWVQIILYKIPTRMTIWDNAHHMCSWNKSSISSMRTKRYIKQNYVHIEYIWYNET